MAHKNKVMQSINLQGDLICVDIFRRPDQSFGFEEFRRDPEDTRGWYPIGNHAHRTYKTQRAALNAAQSEIRWLADAQK